jgi:hypothetical protein
MISDVFQIHAISSISPLPKHWLKLGDVFMICPLPELQLLFGRWNIEPRTTWFGFMPSCLKL